MVGRTTVQQWVIAFNDSRRLTSGGRSLTALHIELNQQNGITLTCTGEDGSDAGRICLPADPTVTHDLGRALCAVSKSIRRGHAR